MFFDSQNDLNMILNNTINNDNIITNSKDGLVKGNMFNNEYKPYKNIVPKAIETTTDKAKLLLKIYELNFAIIDLGLYLDLNKDNQDIYNTFKMYVKKFNEYKDEYEHKYNILCQDNIIKDTYSWTNNPWPFENIGGIKYV